MDSTTIGQLIIASIPVTKAAEGMEGLEIPVGYTDGFVRVQPDGKNRGSFIEGVDTMSKTESVLLELPWTEVDRATMPAGACHPDPRVTYYRAEIPDGLIGRTGMVSLREAGRLGLDVQAKAGKHGPELSAPWTGELAKTTEVWAILGPIGDATGLWSWYAGPVAVFATPRHKELLSRWIADGRGALSTEEVEELMALSVKLQLPAKG